MPTSPNDAAQPLWTAVHTSSPPTTSSPAPASAEMDDRHYRDSTYLGPLTIDIHDPAEADITYSTSLSGHSSAVVETTNYGAGSLQYDSSIATDASENDESDGDGEASGSEAAWETFEQLMRADLAALPEPEDGEEPDNMSPDDILSDDQATEDSGSDAEKLSQDEVSSEEDISEEDLSDEEAPDDEGEDCSVSADKTPSLVGSEYSSSSSDADIEDSRFAEIVYDPLWKYLEMVRGDGASNRMRGATIRQFLRIKHAMDGLSTGAETSQEAVELLLALLAEPEWGALADMLDVSDESAVRDDEQADGVEETESGHSEHTGGRFSS